ncbi:hypothetical protein [Escherichia coli]|uniref:hypothetical protein n=1 Tax=Escherichia coli TaxID=562 RepID=UPI0035B6A4B4
MDGDIKLLGENESIYIPLGRRIAGKPGKIPLDLMKCAPALISKRMMWCVSRIATDGCKRRIRSCLSDAA